MGNCCEVEGAVDHWVYVQTGDRKNKVTDVNVKAILYDVNGQKSPEISLPIRFKSDWERGKTDVFQAPHLENFGDVARIELWKEGESSGGDRKSGSGDRRSGGDRKSGGLAAADAEHHDGDEPPSNWYCEKVIVNDRKVERCFFFPVQRWVRTGIKYAIELNNTSLPQNDPNRAQRDQELELMQEQYQYGQSAPDLPVQVSNLPADEQFSDEHKCDILYAQYQLLDKSKVQKLPDAPWETLEELTNVYTPAMPEPVGIDKWSNDLCFGAQRLIGCNPAMVKLCTDLPENMGITAEMLRPFLEGWSLKQIIEAKRLFVVDLKILENLPTKDNRKLCAPIALFFVTGDKQFVPIAIQLFQHIKPDNPVFLPNDPPFTWLLAKMWFNNADSAVHQTLSHFAYTHLLMESVCVTVHRQLSINHPVYKLLAPHFLFLPAINARGLDQLLVSGGWADKSTTLGRDGMFELIRKGVDEWRMDVQGTFPKELDSRGVLDARVLPNYSYRDDGMLLYKAIDAYVNKIIRFYYETLDKLKNDTEIQTLARDLAISKEDGGAGIKGVPGGGRFKRVEDLVMFCTSVIFTTTVQHAAVNYPQYNEYAFPPQYPSVLNRGPPTDKSAKGEEDVVSIIPDKSTTLEIMSISRLFSLKPTRSLGQWEFQSQYEPFALKAEKEFRDELKKIGEMINERNASRDAMLRYEYLHPDNIPNHICI